jgi:hypothetical protein
MIYRSARVIEPVQTVLLKSCSPLPAGRRVLSDLYAGPSKAHHPHGTAIGREQAPLHLHYTPWTRLAGQLCGFHFAGLADSAGISSALFFFF